MLSSAATTVSTASGELMTALTFSAMPTSSPRPEHTNVNNCVVDAGSSSSLRPTLPTSRRRLKFFPAVNRSSSAVNRAISLLCCCSVSSEALTTATDPLTGRSVMAA